MNGNGTWSWIPRKALISILAGLVGVIGIVSTWWISSINTACAENKIEVVQLKGKQEAQEERYNTIIRKLERIEERLDRGVR